MGESTAIAWTDHTFNPWMGCTKVSPACDHCYAEALGKRTGRVEWGDDAERVATSDGYWRNPLRWNRQAEAEGRQHLVFCASLADVFEDRPELDPLRTRLWALIAETPHLTWQLLTKRPQQAMVTFSNLGWTVGEWPELRWKGPPNLWLGTTVEDQQRAEERIPFLLSIPAPVRFLSCEPLLAPVDLTNLVIFGDGQPLSFSFTVTLNALTGHAKGPDDIWPHSLDWVICGGESGAGHRPLDMDHARSLRDQCAGVVGDLPTVEWVGPTFADRLPVPFFFKQVGGQFPTSGGDLLDGVQHKAFPAGVS